MDTLTNDQAGGTMKEQLRVLLAEREIRNLLLRYCRGVDRCDRELIEGCFHEDALDDHGNWLARGGKDIAEQIISRVAPGGGRAMHFLGNMTIEVEGTSAFAESYLLAFRTMDRAETPYIRSRAVRFIDRLLLRSEQWRISERVVVDEWNRVDPVVERQDDSDLFRWSSKDRQDPVYMVREGRVARSSGDA